MDAFEPARTYLLPNPDSKLTLTFNLTSGPNPIAAAGVQVAADTQPDGQPADTQPRARVLQCSHRVTAGGGVRARAGVRVRVRVRVGVTARVSAGLTRSPEQERGCSQG